MSRSADFPLLLALCLYSSATFTGCGVGLEVDERALITCKSNDDCPTGGYFCNANSGLCVKSDQLDLLAPTIVEPVTVRPAIGNAGTTFTVSLGVSEPLSGPQHAAARALAMGLGYRHPRQGEPR